MMKKIRMIFGKKTRHPEDYKGTSKVPLEEVDYGVDKTADKERVAKKSGWRTSDKTGNRYWESRKNRSDKTPKKGL